MSALIVRSLVSVLGGGVTYTAWLVAALASMNPPAPVSFAVMLTAPVTTALGYGLGTLVGARLTRRPTSVAQAFLWPMLGCITGAVALYPIGPMFVVLGMFALGTAAVVGRDVWLLRGSRP